MVGLVPTTHAFLFCSASARYKKPVKGGWVYIVTNRPNGILYIGVTSDLAPRVWEHREGVFPGFTRQHGLKILVWYDRFEDIVTAIQREKTTRRRYAPGKSGRSWTGTPIGSIYTMI